MTRRKRIQELEQRIGRRKLVWFGTRGTDAQPLLVLSQFSQIFSVISPLYALSLAPEVCLEQMKRERVDLDMYSLDQDRSPQAVQFHSLLYNALTEPATIVTYRPGSFFTSIYYPLSELVEYFGLFHERQAAFEHKPWVESELAKWGVKVVPWCYFGDSDRMLVAEKAERSPLVLRTSRSDGGVGLRLIERPEDIEIHWPPHSDGFIGVAPYLAPNIPLNVNACVFQDGMVSLHSPSVQLIGVEGLTTRTFGYCGNDFARIGDLGDEILTQLEQIVVRAGAWLARNGYIGAFGVDAIVYNGEVFLTEINPRFQGSSALSAQLDIELDRADVFLEHISAFLGLDPSPRMRLAELARLQRGVSQVICHNCTAGALRIIHQLGAEEKDMTIALVPARDIVVNTEAVLAKAIIDDSVTEDGSTLVNQYVHIGKLVASHFLPTAGGRTLGSHDAETAPIPPHF